MKAALHTTRQAIPDELAITRPRMPNLGEDPKQERGWVERMSTGPDVLSGIKSEIAGIRTYFRLGAAGRRLLAAIGLAAKAGRRKRARAQHRLQIPPASVHKTPQGDHTVLEPRQSKSYKHARCIWVFTYPSMCCMGGGGVRYFFHGGCRILWHSTTEDLLGG